MLAIERCLFDGELIHPGPQYREFTKPGDLGYLPSHPQRFLNAKDQLSHHQRLPFVAANAVLQTS